MRIGFVSYWFERGQAYVTRNLINTVSGGYGIFVFAREPDQPMAKTDGEWEHPNITIYPEYRIPSEILLQWIHKNNISIVCFNEEYDFDLVKAVKSYGCKTIGIYYWELFNPIWKDVVNQVYDVVICPTMACANKFQQIGMANIKYIPWGIDLEQFKPNRREPDDIVKFFHPAGWGGLHNRRGTEFVIEAFKRANIPNAELNIHSQKEISIDQGDNISIICGTIPRDVLIATYQAHDVAILPSKWEGIGLTFLESLACGLPVITVDAQPMNEHIKDDYNGICVPGDIHWYDNVFVPGYHVDINAMAEAMKSLQNRKLLDKMSSNARAFAKRYMDWGMNSLHFKAIVDDLAQKLEQKLEQSKRLVNYLIEQEYSLDIDDRVYKRYEKILADPALRGKVLDLGCKHGTLTFMLADAGHCVLSVDGNHKNIEICEDLRGRRENIGNYALFWKARTSDLPFPDNTFDTIIMSKVLEHIEHPEDLAEVNRVLKPDGVIIIVTNLGFAHYDSDHKWFFFPDYTSEMLRHGWLSQIVKGSEMVVSFDGFIERYFDLPYQYQVYNDHESKVADSYEIYCHVYGEEAQRVDLPVLESDTVKMYSELAIL